jgi:inner membrane protein
MAGFSGLAMLPDADVLPLALGVPDVGLFGHRGLTHTLLFALLVAVAAALVARRMGLRPLYHGFFVFLVVGSHGPLDSLTHHSRGVPMLWPFYGDPIEMPWRPIPVAPTGLEFVTARGFGIALVEAMYFLPLLLLSIWPKRRRWKAGLSRALAGGTALVLGVSACLLLAQVALRGSALVSRLEAPVLQELALREQKRPVLRQGN